jgi:bacteriorhodopsin
MSAFVMDRRNDALDINRPNAGRNLSVHGSDWLWAVTAVMGLTFLSWLAWTLSRNKQPRGSSHDARKGNNNDVNNGAHGSPAFDASTLRLERIFHYLFTIAAFIGFISYFTMASDLGNTPVRQYMNHGTNPLQTRQIFYVRYIYWFVAWPLLLTANLLLSGVSWATILFAIALQEIWVVSWLCGALVTTSYKWGYFAFGVFAYIVLAYLLLSWGIEHARRIRTEKDYTLLAGLLVLVWVAFPIAWGLSEGSNRLSVTGEMIFYGILDFIAVPLYGTLFLISTRRFGPALFPFTQTGRVLRPDHTVVPHPGALATSGISTEGGV